MDLVINDPQLKLECLKLAGGNIETALRYYLFLTSEIEAKLSSDL